MARVDLNRYRFDFDLTLAVLLMHPDGTVYHRLGSRPNRDPGAWISTDILTDILLKTLTEHASHQPVAKGVGKRPRRIHEIPAWKIRTARKRPDCVHCHMVHKAEKLEAQRLGRWKRDDMWLFPEPKQVGLELDERDQTLIREVASASMASRAGLKVGDRLVEASGASLLTINDLQWQLHSLPADGAKLLLTIQRDGGLKKLKLPTQRGWRVTAPEDYAWRAFKWELKPQPGFGGPVLMESEKKRLSIDPKKFAFRIGYLVTWGHNAASGRNAVKAGLRKGDIILSIDGKDDFESINHFHAWFRLTRKIGQKAVIQIIRAGSRQRISLPVQG